MHVSDLNPCSMTVFLPHGGAVAFSYCSLALALIKSCKVCNKNNMLFISKSQDEDSQMMTEVDLFISTKAVKVLNADTQVSKSFVCWFNTSCVL